MTSIAIVDGAITPSLWWATLLAADLLHAAIRQCLIWAESCPCHQHLDERNAGPGEAALWATCPLKGRRLP